jgi:phosphoribosylaminoimidazole-succinocarboxamide synthase
MTDDYVQSVSDRYIELYEKVTGKTFIRAESKDALIRMEKNINDFLKSYGK